MNKKRKVIDEIPTDMNEKEYENKVRAIVAEWDVENNENAKTNCMTKIKEHKGEIQAFIAAHIAQKLEYETVTQRRIDVTFIRMYGSDTHIPEEYVELTYKGNDILCANKKCSSEDEKFYINVLTGEILCDDYLGDAKGNPSDNTPICDLLPDLFQIVTDIKNKNKRSF